MEIATTAGNTIFLGLQVLGGRAATTHIPHILLNAAIEHPLPSLKQGSKDGKDISHEKPRYMSRNKHNSVNCTSRPQCQ